MKLTMKGSVVEPCSGGRYGMGDWFTHYPFLVTALARTQPTKILELGTGDFSSTVFHSWVQGNPAATCLSLENDATPGWYEQLSWMHSENHKFQLVKDFRDFSPWREPWDLVFIDYDPEVERGAAVEFFAPLAKVMILHDCNYEGRYNRELDMYKYVVHDRRYRLFTAMASNTVDVEEWFR